MLRHSIAIASSLGLGLAALVAVACGDSSANSAFGDGTSGGTSGTSGSSGTSGTSGTSGFPVGTSGGTSGTSGKGGDGGPEICDGIDNDGNGIIDDVDVGHDGICDCLRIATLGVKGQWGAGNVFAQWLNGKSTAGAVDLAAQTLTPALLGGYQVIVAQDLSAIGRTYSAAEITALGDWVKAGGGLLTLIGYGDASERANANAILATFGMSYAAAPILAKQGGSTIPVTTWVAHPVTSGILKIGVDNGYETQGSGTTVATEQSLKLLQVKEVSSGKVIAWGDEWITYDSEWSAHPDYQVERFWLNMIKWMTPAKECQVAIPPTVK